MSSRLLRAGGSLAIAPLVLAFAAVQPGSADAPKVEAVVDELLSLSPEELRAIERWLEHRADAPRRSPRRNPFREARPAPAATAPPTPRPAPPPVAAPAQPDVEPPRLRGFVFPSPGREDQAPLAAIELGGRLRLVSEGDDLDGYRVESITVGERVDLVETASGERLRLAIDER